MKKERLIRNIEENKRLGYPKDVALQASYDSAWAREEAEAAVNRIYGETPSPKIEPVKTVEIPKPITEIKNPVEDSRNNPLFGDLALFAENIRATSKQHLLNSVKGRAKTLRTSFSDEVVNSLVEKIWAEKVKRAIAKYGGSR